MRYSPRKRNTRQVIYPVSHPNSHTLSSARVRSCNTSIQLLFEYYPRARTLKEGLRKSAQPLSLNVRHHRPTLFATRTGAKHHVQATRRKFHHLPRRFRRWARPRPSQPTGRGRHVAAWLGDPYPHVSEDLVW